MRMDILSRSPQTQRPVLHFRLRRPLAFTTNLTLSEEALYMQAQVKYQTETRIVPFGSGTIRINNLTPILTQKERERRRAEVEKRLFDVFSKYA